VTCRKSEKTGQADVLKSENSKGEKENTMKRLFALFIAAAVAASVARAGDVKIKAVLATGPDDEPATTFASNTPKIFALFRSKGLQEGDKVRGVWIGEDVGDAAPPNTKIDEKALTAEGDTDDGVFAISKPTKGWPVGKYRVEIYVGDELATKVKFTIKAPEETEKEPEKSGEVPEETELKSMTEASLLSFGRAVKKKDFSKFYEDVASVWQKQTSPEKLAEVFSEFFDKGIDLPSVVKDMEPIFNHPAAIGANDVLLIQGYYPTKPNRVIFKLKYLSEEGEWKLFGIDVNLKE
jgi:hypothetical protein